MYFINYILRLKTTLFLIYGNLFHFRIRYIFATNIYFLNTPRLNHFSFELKRKAFDKFNNVLPNNNLHRFDNWASFQIFENPKVNAITSPISKVNWTLTNLFFLFNYSVFNVKFRKNHNLSFFSVLGAGSKLLVINTQKLLNRWKNSYDFIFNIFYFNINFTIFSSSIFKKETLSINWASNQWSLSLWKFYSPFFIFQPNRYNKKIDFFFKKLKQLDFNFFIVTDCLYHYKNLFYLKKNNNFTLGLINFYDSPWIVSYPIVSFFDNYLIQSFFFKILIYLQKQSIFLKFRHFKKLWSNFQLNSFLLDK